MLNKERCGWCVADPLYVAYHDQEWGVPTHDDQILFTFLNLEGMQAGLSWLTILRKRMAIEKAFYQFDPHRIVRLLPKNTERLMQNANIIRNKLKINAVLENARAYLKWFEEKDSFSNYLWQFVDGKPVQHQWQHLRNVPCTTSHSETMSKELKKKGFRFVGPTICYAFMQAVGMVNDHLTSCFRHHEV